MNRRSNLVLYESRYFVDSINQTYTSQGYYKLSCGERSANEIRRLGHRHYCQWEKSLFFSFNISVMVDVRCQWATHDPRELVSTLVKTEVLKDVMCSMIGIQFKKPLFEVFVVNSESHSCTCRAMYLKN